MIMDFIKLTQPKGDPILVNLALVKVMIRQEYQEETLTEMYYTDDKDFSIVKETSEEILRLAGSNYPKADIIKIVNRLDPDCPDPGAYVDGHCSIAELVLSSKEVDNAVKIYRRTT